MTDGRQLDYELVETTLDNGLRVCVQPDAHAPAVAVNIWYEVGSFDEEPHRTGFAHLFEHLMFQGSANVASGEHMSLVEANGGSVNATTSTDRTNYFETVPRGALELALWLEADRMSSLAITDANFAAQREVVKEEKRQRYDNQPYGDLLELLVAQHFHAEHPYGHLPIGSMAHLDDATLDDVQQFFDDWYRPSNARLVLCGPVEPDEAFALAQKYLGAVPARDRPHHIAVDPPHLPARQTITYGAVPHPLVYLSWPTPPAAHDDHLALDVALSILADGNTSRLHKSVVRSRRLAAEVHAASLPHLRSTSITTLMARPSEGVSTHITADALVEELARFADDGPTPEELARAVAQYERDWLLQLSTVEGRADLINDAWLTYCTPTYVNRHAAELAALDIDAIRDAVRTHLLAEPSQLHYLPTEVQS
ncbi:MAG: pitrilysin family protein [Propionibacteriaceae bacterium]|nr:pitrilysin family protein [Propionibacteriaceae bacterium]